MNLALDRGEEREGGRPNERVLGSAQPIPALQCPGPLDGLDTTCPHWPLPVHRAHSIYDDPLNQDTHEMRTPH